MTIVVLGPGGVGGLLAGALARAAEPVAIVGRERTVAAIAERGLRVESLALGDFTVRPRAQAGWREPCECLIVATKASGLQAALARIEVRPAFVLPLLNGLDHLETLRARFGPEAVLAGTIRVEATRTEPGVVLHTSPFLLVQMASASPAARAPMHSLAQRLSGAGIPAEVIGPASAQAEAQVMWSKLVRLAPLACMTSAYNLNLGDIRSDPALRAEILGAIEECSAVARAEGLDADPALALAELDEAHASLGSSMQRDIAARRPPELDAIPGSVVRAGARHGLRCPTLERLMALIAARAAAGSPTIYARP